MKFNPQIKDIFVQNNINYDEGMLYLLSIYFNLNIDEKKFEESIKQVNFTKIVERNYSTIPFSIVWNVPLFEGMQTNILWEWVTDYRNMFKNIRPDRASTINICLARMKNFFSTHPSVRKEDVMEATRMYLSTVKDPAYLVSAHYFIKKDKGINEASKLEEFLDILSERSKTVSIKDKMLQ